MEGIMKKMTIAFLALFLAGCEHEKTAGHAAPVAEKTEAKAEPPARKERRVRGHGYPKLSPFEAVRWREAAPEVRVKDVWYELLSLNGVSSRDILAFLKSVEKDEDGRQKRFEEDLVEVLSLMGHEVGKNATLKVRRLDSGKEEELKDVAMTEKNRDALRDARQQRQQKEARPGDGAAPPF
jgi:hypothetical protein